MGCRENTRSHNSNEKKPFNSTLADAVFKKIFLSDLRKEIFYGIYSPVEISKIIQHIDVTYNPDRFLSVNESSKFTTSSEIALALGMYGADFSLAKMFQNTEDAIQYLEVISEMSKKIGIPEEFVMESTDRVEQNIGQIDSLSQIAFEIFDKSSTFLVENDRLSSSKLVMLGGWLEGLYQLSNYLEEKSEIDPVLVNLIVEQKYTLNYLMGILKSSYHDPDVANYYRMLKVLKKYFDRLDFKYKKDKIQIDKTQRIIDTEWTQLDYSEAEIFKIKDTIDNIRNIMAKS